MRITYPEELPVSRRREDLLAAIGEHQVVVVAGETGSGKTTQLPKLCLELGRGEAGQIAHTQPRRIAARTVAERIAEELGVGLGDAVGYAVRFDDRSSRDTRIRLMTDGLLLAEIQHDRMLRRYDTIIVDEAHERSLNIDFLLGYLKRLLPRRPDLKLIITSATIDPGRFAAHFGDAPVVEVSGRTYPVEVRERPLEPGADLPDAIADAVEELPGDTLVFLSGEREIRDAADVLSGRLGDAVEVLPLYARLSSAEQRRIFRPGPRRRVVLATNVAETSLTVPRIKAVVDPGTARISRYSARLKVQRLPIEPVSQASADQRKGRCGRTSPGVCIRLYDDYADRPRFTDPEILRTNLASVILQMAALRLGDVEDFPFLDPPDRRQVRDGVNLLVELGALDAGGALTALGRRLAGLPVDPRFGRMVLEAGRLGCVEEVIVIAAALSIQDPRERPADQRAQADQSHARFKDDSSDFLGYLNLWRYLREQQRALSGNQFRKRCRAEFLHHLRVREWQDLVGQLRSAARDAGVKRNAVPGEPHEIHRALLSGLLSHVGARDARTREYEGARGARFMLWPGSAVKGPSWVMVAELVETSRLWGREVARIRPEWVEPLAAHLVKRSYSEPRWDRRRAQVVATERVTLYGLPIVTGRTVAYARIDAAAARELFIRRALVEGDWDTGHAFVDSNRRRVEQVERLEDRVRRRDLLAPDEARFAFLDSRIPADVVSGAHFDRWWRDERRRHPDLLDYPRSALVAEDAADALDPQAFPTGWRSGDAVLRLTYRFEPGHPHDGVTVHVPLTVLPSLRPDGFEWLVPGLRRELVTALLRSLPKEQRRRLVPLPDTAAAVLSRLRPRREPLVDALAREVGAAPGDFDVDRLPPHLRMTFAVEGEDVADEDLDALKAAVAPRLRAQLTAATASVERSGLRDWTFGELPRVVELPGTDGRVRAHPALVDEGDSVAVRSFETPAAQAAAMWAGTRRLLALTVPSPARAVERRLANAAKLALVAAPHGSLAAVVADATEAALDALMRSGGGPAWDAPGFARLRDHVAGELAEVTAGAVERAAAILEAFRDVQRRLDELALAAALREARLDVAGQIGGLVYPGFVADAGVERLEDVERYLRGAAMRLERLPSRVAVDADRMRVVHELEGDWRGAGRAPAEVRWLLEELRVSFFAEGLGVRGSVSAKRIRALLRQATR